MCCQLLHVIKHFASKFDFRTYLLLDFGFGAAAGFIITYYFEISYPLRDVLYYGMELVGIGSTLVALAAAELAWGWPQMSSGHRRVLRESLMCLWFAGLTIGWEVLKRKEKELASQVLWLLAVPTVLAGIRGWPVCFGGVCFWAIGYVNEDRFPSPIDDVFRPYFVKIAIAVGVCGRLQYLRDQRLAFSICMQPIMAWMVGVNIRFLILGALNGTLSGGLLVQFFLVVALGAGFVYLNLLMRRRGRSLPPGLHKAKFVRLGFLREMLHTGQTIKRCQELPEEAFGDAWKAIHFIVLSHRWCDPLTSDVATPEFPQGVKLANLVRRLDAHFFPPGCDAHFFPPGAGGLWDCLNRWYRTCCIGDWDVLLFFDFLSIPQKGIAEDGTVIPRTYAERAVFDECLPNMGTLYSLFPVLALTDVPAGDTDHNYIDSGWCFAEFTIAMLAKQLTHYSTDAVKSFKRQSLVSASLQMMDCQAAETFQRSAISELRRRPFASERDRMVAGGIIKGFLTKRLLADSIRRGDTAEVQRLLARLNRDGLLSTLHEPVDSNLNTLLHIAVQSRNVDAVDALLRNGANPQLRNLRGDTPSQWFLLPRLSAAAQIVRAHVVRAVSQKFDGTVDLGSTMLDLRSVTL